MKIKSYSHIAFQVKNMEAILDFYCNKLGMKQKFVLTADDILDYAMKDKSAMNDDVKGHIEFAKSLNGKPLIVYVEMAPSQFIEFFYVYEELEYPMDLAKCYGYQHLAIEVEDLEEARRSLIEKGIEPDTDISRGPDYTKQLWIHDPEGNRIEFMEYTDLSFQVVGK